MRVILATLSTVPGGGPRRPLWALGPNQMKFLFFLFSVFEKEGRSWDALPQGEEDLLYFLLENLPI